MNPRTLTSVILLLLVGFSSGWLIGSRRPAPVTGNDLANATAALDELVAYRGTGARAARKVIRLVDTIVAGGGAMVPKIDAAFGKVSPHRYVSSGDQAPGVIEMDTLRGILSRHSTATIALLEALDRIGGDAVVPILIREAERQGAKVPTMDRITSVLFLSKRADRSDVRIFLNKRVDGFLSSQKNDWETVRVLQIAARYLEPEMWDRLSGAFQTGWAAANLADEIAHALVQLDAKRASELFLTMLADASLALPLRQASARAIARMPAHWDTSVALVLGDPEPHVVAGFVRGLRVGRWDEKRVLWRDAAESGDAETLRAYELERLPLLERSVVIIRRFAEAVGPEWAKRLDLPKRIAEFDGLIGEVRTKYKLGD
ncbi:MAG: hypothetical protein ABFS86_06555 [Planctomycetota bacterium]